MTNRVEIFFDMELAKDIVFRNAWIENFRARRIENEWFVSSQSGSWILLSDEEYSYTQSVSIPIELFKKLESRFLIITELNSAGYYKTYEKWTTPHFRHPVHHIILSTLRCNLGCLYCHADVVPANAGKSYDLSIEKATEILNFAIQSKSVVQSFEFQGGESLLNKQMLFKIIPEIRKRYAEEGKMVYIAIQTNGILLTDEIVEFLRANKVKIGTSVDGPKEVHDRQRVHRSGKGSYDLVQKAVSKYNLLTLPTITSNSAGHYREIIDRQLKTGQKVISYHNVYPINNAKRNWGTIGLDSADYLNNYSEVCSYLKSLWKDGFYPLERRLHLALKKLVTAQDVDFSDFGNPCGMVHSQIAYHTNGDVYTCDEGRDFPEFKLGNVAEESYDEIIFGSKMRALKSLSMPNDIECKTCAYKAFCSACPVYDRSVEGKLTAKHAGTHNCHYTKLIFDTLIKWLKNDKSLMAKLISFHGLKAAYAF